MSSNFPDVARALRALSSILQRELHSSDSLLEPNPVTVSRRIEEHAFSIHSPSSHDFSTEERDLLEEIVSLVVESRRTGGELMRVEERLRMIERENVDLTMRSRALAEVSAKDALTGLYARWYVMEKIEEELNRAMRHGSAMAVMMVDLDHFKKINDSYGHLAGDLVLQTVGQLVKDSLRVYDIPGRYGGEEFCLMLPETPIENTAVVAERIRKNVAAAAMSHDERNIQVTASIGVAGIGENTGIARALTATELIERADRALYRAKETGRNRVEQWDNLLLQGIAYSTNH